MPVKAYLSNIAPRWPIGKQETLLAAKVPGWPDVGMYCDTLSGNMRKAHNAGSLTERAQMLRGTARKATDETVYVASVACVAWSAGDFADVLGGLSERGATLISLNEGLTIPPQAGARVIASAMKVFASAKRTVAGGGPQVGAEASAKTRRAASDEAIEKIKDRWKLPTKDYPTWELLKEAQLSRNTVVERLGKRPDAQKAHQAALKRAAKRRAYTSRVKGARA